MKHLITLGFLIAAFAMYGIGQGPSAGILFCIGGVCELIFWKRIFNLRKK